MIHVIPACNVVTQPTAVVGTLQVSYIALVTVSTIFSTYIPQFPVVCAYMYVLCTCQCVPPLSPSQACQGK